MRQYYWRLMRLSNTSILLHYVADLPQYRMFGRVPNWLVKRMLKQAKSSQEQEAGK